jgi:hypothetical protein
MLRSYISRFYLAMFFLLLMPVMFHRINVNPRSVIWSDAEGYYKYLPAVFILGDVHQMPSGSVWPLKNDKGEYLNKYTCGVSYFQAPFFLIARAYGKVFTKRSEDIFNNDYARAAALSGYCAAFLGLFFLQRVLRRRFAEPVVFLTLVAVFGGTNLFHYATREPGMSHVYSFCLMAFLVWWTTVFYEKPTLKNAAVLGGALGWLVLIRSTNLVVVLFILFFEVYNGQEAAARFQFWKSNARLFAAAALSGCLFWLPQMAYWHEMTGEWFRYSYTDESFKYWREPKIAAVLLDPQNGLLLYSPMVLVMLAALGRGVWQSRHSAPAIAGIFVISTYLFASWWAWWFGGAFGARSYVELFALLAFPMAGVLQSVSDLRSGLLKGFSASIFVFLVYYSVRLSFLYNTLPGPWDGAEWRWNWAKMLWIWEHLI